MGDMMNIQLMGMMLGGNVAEVMGMAGKDVCEIVKALAGK